MRIARIADIAESVGRSDLLENELGPTDVLDVGPLISRVASAAPLEQIWPAVEPALGMAGIVIRLRSGDAPIGEAPIRTDRRCMIRSSTGAVLGHLELPIDTPRPTSEQRRRIRSVCQLLAIAVERESTSTAPKPTETCDPLTGLPSRRVINKAIRAAEERTREAVGRRDDAIAVMVLNIDGFSLINDAHGHEVGDALLAEAADRMRRTLRGADSIFRLSGDQFVLVCTKIKGQHDAEVVAERLMEVLAEPFDLDGEKKGVRHRVSAVTASIGIALTDNKPARPTQLRREADVALRRAKSSGRNTYSIYDTATGAAALDQLKLESELRCAFESTWTFFQAGCASEDAPFGRFELHWQPQVNSAGVPIGFEALARWPHPTRKMVPPMQFIPAAEKCGQIVAFGRWALQTACRQGGLWYRAGLRGPNDQPLRIAVNVSALEFARADLLEHVCQSLEESDLPPDALELELTESVLMNDTAVAVDKLHGLQDAGIRIAIDDFGTGYSSLAYLHQMPLNTLKIDRTFVMEIDDQTVDEARNEKSKTAVLRSVCSLGHTLGLELVAEGVETAFQRDFCTGLGAQVLQGYHFSKPLPPLQVEQYLADTLLMRSAA
ncbi:MAG: bifunctional diguanylate cyclase/phosphodiesterase [Planctomycetota bacterium]